MKGRTVLVQLNVRGSKEEERVLTKDSSKELLNTKARIG